MTDDQFDQFLAKSAKEYRQPPETPREEIWARIQAARQAPQTNRGAEVVDLSTRRKAARGWYLAAVALAAALILGIAIGRWSGSGQGARTQPVAPATVATVTADSADLAGQKRGELVLRFAAVEHLSRIETLLTDYESGTLDSEFEATARDLLARTRLILDSKSLVDPRLRSLLDDLELILAQIAQVPSSRSDQERKLIEDGINERQVRARLRNAIPAGPTA